MPRYVVTLEETVTYDVIVEAEDEEAAAEAAEEKFVQSEKPTEDFTITVLDREVSNIEEMADAGA